MIGVDTNILLRAIAGDGATQTPRAQAFLQERSIEDPAVINPIVMAEMVWTLRRKYRMRREEVLAILSDIMESPVFRILDRTSILRALEDYRDGAGQFTDALIGHLNAEAGCRATVTFDHGAPSAAAFLTLD